jgi:integrase
MRSNYKYTSILTDEITQFIALRKSRGLRTTCETALRVLDAFLVKNNVSDKALSSVIIDRWAAESYEHLNPNTAKNYISHYIQFAKYLVALEINAFIPLISYYKQTYTPYLFSESEITAIIDVADNMVYSERYIHSATDFQMPVLLRILLGCGLRLGEALNLKRSDLDFEQGVLYIHNAKGNNERIVPMDDSLQQTLLKYRDKLIAEKPNSDYLFDSLQDCKRTNAWARIWFNRILQKAEIALIHGGKSSQTRTRNICLNCFRHTFAVESLRQQIALGVDTYRSTPLLSIYLGHTKISGTMRYLHMTEGTATDIYNIVQGYTEGMFPGVPV